MPDRREALKIIGAIGATCAFPYASDELYGQHVHIAAAPIPPPTPSFFAGGDFAVISRLAELIIPPTDTPGAIEAGVPSYIDLVVGQNPEHQAVYRSGLDWLERTAKDRYKKSFVQLSKRKQIALLKPLSNAVDDGEIKGDGERFFAAIKSMTADGYYTSKPGMTTELGFKGGAMLAQFPSCEVPEH